MNKEKVPREEKNGTLLEFIRLKQSTHTCARHTNSLASRCVCPCPLHLYSCNNLNAAFIPINEHSKETTAHNSLSDDYIIPSFLFSFQLLFYMKELRRKVFLTLEEQLNKSMPSRSGNKQSNRKYSFYL